MTAVDSTATVVTVHTAQDDTDHLMVQRHTTVYTDGERITEYHLTIEEDGETTGIMLTRKQFYCLQRTLLQEWSDERALHSRHFWQQGKVVAHG